MKQVFKWPEHSDKIVPFYINKDTSEAVRNIMPFCMRPLNKNYIQASDDMLLGKYHIPPYGIFDYSMGIHWANNPSYTISFMRSLHGHFFICDLLESFRETKDNKYIHLGYQIIKDWILKNPSQKPSHRMAWHDEATARRLVVWIRFFDEARKLLLKKDVNLLLTNIFDHAKLLSTNSFHATNTNHGMFQDESLIAFSEYFDQLDVSIKYRHIAKKRLKNYFDFIISKDGVHLEHSPSYHQIAASSILKYWNYFSLKQDDFGAYLSSIYERMATYGTYVIKPDGKWPLISDTFINNKPSTLIWKDNPYYKYAVSKGLYGEPPAITDTVFRDAGYAIFRDNWKSGEKGTYIFFNAAYHVNYHKHNDDLSVWIYSNGDIISESGPNGYDMKDPYTMYAYSSFAHNTLIVDDTSLQRGDKKFGKTYLLDYGIGTDSSFVSGVNKRFPGVKHTRTLKYLKSNSHIQIIDKIESNTKHNYKILWHLALGVTPEINENKVNLVRDGKKVMELKISSNSTFTVQNVHGQTVPILLGWYMGEVKKQCTPIHTLVIELESRSTEIISYFKII